MSGSPGTFGPMAFGPVASGPVAPIIKVWSLFTRMKMAHITSPSTRAAEFLPGGSGGAGGGHTLSF